MLVEVTFLPENTTVWVPAGSTLLAAARRAGITLVASCGGRGTCGGCGVRVLEGTLADPDDIEFGVLPRLPKGVRLGCRARVAQRCVVEPMVKYRAPSTGAAAAVSFGSATSLYDLEDDDDVTPSPGTSVSAAAPEAEPAPVADLMVAVDLGTTNVAVVVLEKGTNREVGRGAAVNRQRSWGADVLSRLSAAIASPDDATMLRDAGQRSVIDAIEVAAGEPFDTVAARIVSVVISANSVMAPLLAGADASSLAAAPFAPVEGVSLTAGPLVERAPRATFQVLEPLANFVGGDIRAGLLATNLLTGTSTAGRLDPKTVLFIDMGTNVEVALATPERLTVASAPAGSAFEGIATDGAFMHGSALIAALADARRSGALDATGLLQESDPRVSRDAQGVMQLDVTGSTTDRVHISQLAIREFQLAKAAVRAAVSGVLRAADTAPDHVERIVVAGAFGGAVTPTDLVDLGVLPAVSPLRVNYAYNASLTGAVLVALSQKSDVGVPLTAVDLVGQDSFSAELVAFTALDRG